MINTPIGLAWRTGFVRMTKKVFDKPATKTYLISEMNRTRNNIMPIVVLNEITGICNCFMINRAKNGFDAITDSVLERRVEGIATYMIEKLKIQESNKSVKEKERLAVLNEKNNYRAT